MIKRNVLILVLLLILVPSISLALPAFPGAEGFGSTTIGGRGGTVCKVTRTADDSNAGSLRYCLTRSYPRYVIFTTGGTITLGSSISISNPYITIAGQTAPGDGIQVKGRTIYIMTHDVIIRGMRFRLGPVSGADAMTVGWGAYNVVIDHSSFMWGTDENLSLYSASGAAHDITFSWNIVAEGLLNCSVCESNHSMGTLVGEGTNKISIHHSIYSSRDRNPLVKQDVDDGAELINNLIYNWYYRCGEAFSPVSVINNYFRYGAATSSSRRYACFSVSNGGESPDLPSNSVYVQGNINDGTVSDNWDVVDGSTSWEASSPYYSLSGITQDDASDVMSLLTDDAGAGAIIPSRDSQDQRIITQIANRTGSYYADPSSVGGWDSLAAGSAPTDTDGDGMPDSWEQANGTNYQVADHNGDIDLDGYRNIEEWFNGLITEETNPPPGDSTPDQFSFNDETEGFINHLYASQTTVTVTGITTTAAVSVSGDTDCSYSRNSAPYTSSPGEAELGDTFNIRVRSSSSFEEDTNCTLTIGGVSDTFTVTTSSEPVPSDSTPPVFTETVDASFPYGVTSVTLSGTTDEDATCRYSSSSGTAYNDMTSTFTGSISTSHSSVIGNETISDAFNRADESPIDSPWVKNGSSTSDAISLISSAAIATGNGHRNASYYNSSIPSDQCSEIIVTGNGIGPSVHVQSGETYETGIVFRGPISTDQYASDLALSLYNTDGTLTVISHTQGSASPGDKLRICVSGNDYTAYVNDVEVEQLAVTDNTYVAGYAGIHTFLTNVSGDDWRAYGLTTMESGTYNYYVKCQDQYLNTSNDVNIQFTIEEASQPSSPTNVHVIGPGMDIGAGTTIK